MLKNFIVILFFIFFHANCNKVTDVPPDQETKTYSIKIIFDGDIEGLNNLRVYIDDQQIEETAEGIIIESIKYGHHKLHIVPNLAYKEIYDTLFVDKNLSLTYNLFKKQIFLLQGLVTDSNSVISDVTVTAWIWNNIDSLKKTVTDKNGYFSILSLEGSNNIKLDKFNYEELIDTIINDGKTLHNFKMVKDYKWEDYFPLTDGKEFKYKYYYEYYDFNCCHNIIDGILNCKIVKLTDAYYLNTIIEGKYTHNRLIYGEIDTSYVEPIIKEIISVIKEEGNNNFTVIIPNYPVISLKRFYLKDEPNIINAINEEQVSLKQKRNVGIFFYKFSRTISTSLTISDNGEISLIE